MVGAMWTFYSLRTISILQHRSFTLDIVAFLDITFWSWCTLAIYAYDCSHTKACIRPVCTVDSVQSILCYSWMVVYNYKRRRVYDISRRSSHTITIDFNTRCSRMDLYALGFTWRKSVRKMSKTSNFYDVIAISNGLRPKFQVKNVSIRVLFLDSNGNTVTASVRLQTSTEPTICVLVCVPASRYLYVYVCVVSLLHSFLWIVVYTIDRGNSYINRTIFSLSYIYLTGCLSGIRLSI